MWRVSRKEHDDMNIEFRRHKHCISLPCLHSRIGHQRGQSCQDKGHSDVYTAMNTATVCDNKLTSASFSDFCFCSTMRFWYCVVTKRKYVKYFVLQTINQFSQNATVVFIFKCNITDVRLHLSYMTSLTRQTHRRAPVARLQACGDVL